MTPDEVARLLAKCSAFDQRTVGRADVLAWHEAIGDLDPEVAMRAVSGWYRDNDDRINPARLRRAYVTVQAGDRRQNLDDAHDRRLQALDEAPRKDRTADVSDLIRPRPHNLTLRRRDLAGTTWAWSCSCGQNPIGQQHPAKDAARDAGRAHMPDMAAVG